MFSSNTSSAAGGYQISRSLRFNSADSAYLNRTPASAGNRRTWTWSAWVKRGAFGAAQELFSAVGLLNDSELFGLGLNANDKISVGIQTVNVLVTTAVYRDPSAWYHIVFALDTPQATASNRAKLYVNGVQVTTFDTTNYPSQNADLGVNFTSVHGLGFLNLSGFFRYLNGYMTEVNFIDGQALTPSSFGQTNAQTGVWEPVAYSGSYGTNGFYLNFSDNSNTTAATLGKDYSGNGNNWTPNNFSVSAGAGNDSLVDTPTPYGVDTGAGGEVRGNYATLNPLKSTKSVANGNLTFIGASGSYVDSVYATFGVTGSGKYYFETTGFLVLGFNSSDVNPTTDQTTGRLVYHTSVGAFYNGSTAIQSGLATSSSTDVVGVALNLDAGTLAFYKNNTQLGTNITISASSTWFPFFQNANTADGNVNFGQRPFAYTAPSGFKALCTQNLPTPTIGATSTTQAGKYFNPVLYTGNSSSRTITGVGFQPDFTWIKIRDAVDNHYLFDAVRGKGTTYMKTLYSNATNAESPGNSTSLDVGVTDFASDGFTFGSGSLNGNQSPYTFVAWNWKANGTGSSNTAGSITSTVSANTTSGFSIVTYTGNGTASTVGHGLGVAPSMVIVKQRSASGNNWGVYHASAGATKYLELNTTIAATTGGTPWNNTEPTSTVFTVGTWNAVNANGSTYVAYCFAPIAGYSAFGSYTGNGSTDGTFVYTGFRPAYLLIKRTDTTGDWIVWDAKRNTYNALNSILYPNLSSAEATAASVNIDFLSNGFKLRASSSVLISGDFIYAAFAESPFKYALAR
jgi:hypothetical protein